MEEQVEKDNAALEATLATAETEPVQQEVPVQQKDEREQPLRFQTLREARERAERERDLYKRQLEIAQSNQRPQAPPKQPETYSIAPDDLVEGRHLAKYDQEIKKLRQELVNYQAMSVETRLKSQYRDFSSVVNEENIAMLRTAEPELAEAIKSSPDLYNKAVAAYTMIKKLGIVPDATQNSQQTLAQENAAKPRPVVSANSQPGNTSPLSNVNLLTQRGFSKAQQQEKYREMMEAKRNRR